MSDNKPEAGTRCKVIVGGKEEYAVWTGHAWFSETSKRLLEDSEVESWTEASDRPHPVIG